MAQNKWQMPATVDDDAGTAILTWFPNAFANLRTLHGGTLDPSTPANDIGSAKHMLWADEANSLLMMRNVGDSAWYELGPLEDNLGHLRIDGSAAMTGDLDMNGAGDIIIDADADSKLVCDTDDELSVELGGAEEFLFQATQLDMKGNYIKDCAMNANTNTPSGATSKQLEFKDSGGTTIYVPGYAAAW